MQLWAPDGVHGYAEWLRLFVAKRHIIEEKNENFRFFLHCCKILYSTDSTKSEKSLLFSEEEEQRIW